MFYDICGWIGMILILVDYALLSLKKIENDVVYHLINLMGAAFMALGLFPKGAWFSFWLEIIWGAIAIYAIIRLTNKNNKKQGK